jgi:hypothetical protein
MSWVKVINKDKVDNSTIITSNKDVPKKITIKYDTETIREKVEDKYSIELFDIAFNIKEYCEDYSPNILKKVTISDIINFIQDNIDYSNYKDLVLKDNLDNDYNESDLEI